jgi:hypothetical protein
MTKEKLTMSKTATAELHETVELWPIPAPGRPSESAATPRRFPCSTDAQCDLIAQLVLADRWTFPGEPPEWHDKQIVTLRVDSGPVYQKDQGGVLAAGATFNLRTDSGAARRCALNYLSNCTPIGWVPAWWTKAVVDAKPTHGVHRHAPSPDELAHGGTPRWRPDGTYDIVGGRRPSRVRSTPTPMPLVSERAPGPMKFGYRDPFAGR